MDFLVVVLCIQPEGSVHMFQLNDVFVLRKIYDVNLLVPIKNNKISNDALLLNGTASLIIEECTKADSVENLSSSVCDKFIDVDKNEIFDDILAYTKKLLSDGIIVER